MEGSSLVRLRPHDPVLDVSDERWDAAAQREKSAGMRRRVGLVANGGSEPICPRRRALCQHANLRACLLLRASTTNRRPGPQRRHTQVPKARSSELVRRALGAKITP
jgi:hypothetical protein